MYENPVYEGNVSVYLEGQKALLPVEVNSPDEMTYFIGAEQTNLIIKDFRRNPNQVAERVIAGEEGLDFAEIFNQPAWVRVEVIEETGALEINMHETQAEVNFPVLWLGVIRDGKMPVQNIEWEVLRPTDMSATAFAALVNS